MCCCCCRMSDIITYFLKAYNSIHCNTSKIALTLLNDKTIQSCLTTAFSQLSVVQYAPVFKALTFLFYYHDNNTSDKSDIQHETINPGVVSFIHAISTSILHSNIPIILPVTMFKKIIEKVNFVDY
jgi:hypothetical protein